MRILIDTNVIILHLGGIAPLTRDAHFTVSMLTRFELLRYPGMSRTEETHIRTFLNICEHIPVDERIAERAAFLGRTHRIGGIDLLIAATALELDLPLITQNAKDFRRIPGLDVRSTF